MMSAYMTVWKARFLDVDDVDKKSSVTVLKSPLADLGTINCGSPAGCQQLKTWRVEPADYRIDPPPEWEAPSRTYCEASLCDSDVFQPVSLWLCLESPVSVSSQYRRSRIASALSLHPCNATLIGALASGGVRPIDRVNILRCRLPIVPVLGRLKR